MRVRWPVLVGSLTSLLICTAGAQAQTRTDTLREPLSLEVFQGRIVASHPELAQARNAREQARRMIAGARGGFDPKLAASYDSKRFRGDSYYALTDVALSIPTTFGADVKLGFERASGSKVNPEHTTPGAGLFILGVSIPLGRNLITDERRTLLTRARAFADIADADAIATTNKLLLSATKTYGEWYFAYRKLVVADSGVRLAAFRLASVQARILAGESAPIDSVDARLEMRRREVAVLEARNDERVSALEVSALLWNEHTNGRLSVNRNAPVLSPTTPTGVSDSLLLAAWVVEAQRAHPAVRKADAKIALESADLRLNRQGLLPKVDLGVSALSNAESADALLQPSQWNENFKSAASATTSLLLRKERAKYQESALKVESARLERDLVQRRVAVDIENALHTLIMLERAVQLQRENVVASGLLRDAEEMRFATGESTLLAVNIRERLLLDELIKLEQFQAKLMSSRIALSVARGVPPM